MLVQVQVLMKGSSRIVLSFADLNLTKLQGYDYFLVHSGLLALHDLELLQSGFKLTSLEWGLLFEHPLNISHRQSVLFYLWTQAQKANVLNLLTKE